MKITPEDIIDLILLSKTPSIDSGENRNQIAEINRDLTENGLEIEGYERAQWTKFDPNDPKTLPACNSEWFLIAAQKTLEPPTFTMMAERATQTLLEEIRRDTIKFRLNVYWRPLSKPPVEQEEKCG